MNQRRDRGRASHGVRQPHVERQLGGFASHTEEHEEGDEEHHPRLGGSDLFGLAEYLVKLEGAEIGKNEENGDEQSKITDPVGDESFFSGDSVGNAVLAFFKPDTDEQLGTQAHAFPAKEHHQDWLEAIRTDGKAGSDFSYGGPLTELAMLGVIALKMPGTKLEWDAAATRFTNCDEANQFIDPPYREGWSL